MGRLRLFKLPLRQLSLRVQHGDPLLCGNSIGLRGIEGGLPLPEIGGGLLRPLLGAGSFLEQILSARVFLLCESQRRLRLSPLLRARVISLKKWGAKGPLVQQPRNARDPAYRGAPATEELNRAYWKGAPLMRATGRPPAILANERSMRKFPS